MRVPWEKIPIIACAAAIAVVAGCSAGEAEPGSCEHRAGEAKPGSLGPEDSPDRRQRCDFKAGDKTSETLGSAIPKVPDAVKHVVVVMLENRSFDHFLSDLPDMGDDVAGDEGNPDGEGGCVMRYHETRFCNTAEPAHEWADAHLSLGAGRMDGFMAASQDCGAMGFYTRDDLPVTYALAREFALSARHFSPLLGPTWPNRLFFYLGTSCDFAEGADSNVLVTASCGASRTSILDLLGEADFTFGVYDQSGPFSVILGTGVYPGIPAGFEEFKADVAKAQLPKVSFVGASTGIAFSPTQNDDHPPADVRLGEQFLHDVVEALSGQDEIWRSTILFVTFDEYGGYYDHVEPPAACDPEHTVGQRDYHFDQYGFRVPLLVVSPFVRRKFVSHFDTDHTSITRFIEHWLGLGALTARDANAWPFLDVFDFENPDFTPPALPPAPAGGPCVEPVDPPACGARVSADRCQNR